MRKKKKAKAQQNQAVAHEPEIVSIQTLPGMVRVGDVVARRPVTFTDSTSENKVARLMTGRVVYVHPAGRFHVVEFGEGRRAVREAFAGIAR